MGRVAICVEALFSDSSLACLMLRDFQFFSGKFNNIGQKSRKNYAAAFT